MTKDERAIVWLCALSGADNGLRVNLLKTAPDPDALFHEAERYFPSAVPPLMEREKEIEKYLSDLEKKGVFCVTAVSDDYPAALRYISDPPLMLYGMGNRALLKRRKFCIVGSRIIPPWAQKLGSRIAEELSAHFAIVTGLAEGGDSAAIAGALPRGELISVLPCGILECYPAAHAALKEQVRKSGLLLSEYMPHEKTKKYSFHARNRLLAGLSEGVLVLAAARRSGTLITANCALEDGREVFALPHNAGALAGEGCNDLLKKGAFVCTETGDILDVFGIAHADAPKTDLTPEEETVYSALRELGESHISQLAAKTGLKVFELSPVLSALEIKGLAVKAGGNKYSPL